MTLEQFSNLMEGLGYSAEKAEREKIKTSDNSQNIEVNDQDKSNIDPKNKESTLQPEIMEDKEEMTEEKGIETFYTFKWISKQINNRRSERDKNSSQKDGETGKPKYKRKENKKQKVKSDKPKSFEARPKKEHKIDPDNPFAAALMDFSKKN